MLNETNSLKFPFRNIFPAYTQGQSTHQCCQCFDCFRCTAFTLSIRTNSVDPYHTRRLVKVTITKTRLYNFDPLKPHFYIVKLGFTGIYIICLISAQNIDCGYSLEPPRRGYPLEPPRRGGSNEYPQSMF